MKNWIADGTHGPALGPDQLAGMQAVATVHREPFVISSRIWWISLTAILLVALAARLLYLGQVAALPFFDLPTGDSAVYLKRAREIASGVLLPTRPFFYGSIFYPYFLAIVLKLTNGSLYSVCLSQIAAGVSLVALLAVLTRRLYGPVAGIAAGAIAALYGPFAFLEADLLGVVWALVAMMIAMLALEAWQRTRSRSVTWLCVAGLSLGLAATERPNLILLIPIVAAWCAHHASRGRTRSVLSLFAASVAPLALVTMLNVAGTGQLVPLTTSAGINLSIGYHTGSPGTFEEPWEKDAPEFSAQHTDLEEASNTMASTRAGRSLTPQEASSYWQRVAVHYIASHPAAAIAVTLRKTALMLNSVEVPNHLDYLFVRRLAPALWLMPISFGAVLALAVLGIFFAFMTGRRRPETALMISVVIGSLVSVIPFFVADRYRIPILPPMIVLAGAGVAMLLRFTNDPLLRTDRRFLVAFPTAIVMTCITMLPLTCPLMGHDYWMLAQAYQAKQNLPAAIAAYESAVRVEGKDASLLNNLATAYRQAGRRDQAIATLRHAIKVDPRLALPHKNLGMMLIATGDMAGAMPELREAISLDPTDAQTLGAIGALLAERGDNSEAASAFANALRLAPADPRIIGLLKRFELEPRPFAPPFPPESASADANAALAR